MEKWTYSSKLEVWMRIPSQHQTNSLWTRLFSKPQRVSRNNPLHFDWAMSANSTLNS
jgi:hypothetical protein